MQVGYNNKDGYWVARNSWGQGFADGGYFKVRGLIGVVDSRCHVVGMGSHKRSRYCHAFFNLPVWKDQTTSLSSKV